MATERIRIHELAKKLNLSSKEVMTTLSKNLGIEAKSHASTISQEEADKIAVLFEKKVESSPVAQKQETPKPIEPKEQPKPEIKQEIPVEPKKQPEVEEKSAITQPTPPERRPEPRSSIENRGLKIYPERRPEHRPRSYQDRPQEQRPTGEARDQRPYPPRTDQRPGFDNRPPRPYQDRPQEQRPAGEVRDQRPYSPRPDQRPGFDNRPPRPFKKPESGEQLAPEGLEKPQRREDYSNKKKDNFRDKEELKREKLEEQKLQAKLAERKKTKEEQEEEIKEKVKEVSIESPLTVGELAEKLGESIAAVIKQLMLSGILATVNQTLDVATAKKAAEALEYTIIEPETESGEEKDSNSIKPEEKEGAKLVEKAPVVTIMGHVDHGKTTLLDAIRKTKHKIVSTEAGGITQSIGAYTAEINNKKIVFIDTPGHSAFTAMRARGAKVTDIVVLVVAADDGIMPQTIEAINHAKAAKVPIIIAVNKIDKDNADPERVLKQLTEYALVSEKWGGDTITVEVSALKELNLDALLEYILLVAELEELKANPDRPATGVIIESQLDKGKGAIATFLVQTGTLRVGDYIVAGTVGGKVRALINDSGKRIHKAGPSTPVEVLGLPEVPEAGEIFDVVENDKTMKEIIGKRKEESKNSRLESISPVNIKRESLLKKVEGETKELNIIVKAGTHGSAEAISSSLQQLETKKIFVKIVHLGVGDISEADVMLASASNAILIGFGVKEDSNALRIAGDEGVIIRKYDIIYKMLEDIEQTMLGLLEPEYKEIEIGSAEVRQVFTVGKNVKIAGCYVLDGKIARNTQAKIFRNGKEIYKGNLSQLKRFKDDVKEVASGYECGMSFDKFNDIEVGDVIKALTKVEIQRHSLV